MNLKSIAWDLETYSSVGEKLPEEILDALEDETVEKWSYNSQFERICLSRFLGYPAGNYLAPASWRCSMVWASTLGLPRSLESVGAVLGLEKQKLTEGKDLIRYFCVPCRPTKRPTKSLPTTRLPKAQLLQHRLAGKRRLQRTMLRTLPLSLQARKRTESRKTLPGMRWAMRTLLQKSLPLKTTGTTNSFDCRPGTGLAWPGLRFVQERGARP